MHNLFGKNVCSINIDLDKVYVSYNHIIDEKITKKTKFMSLHDFISSCKNINTSLVTPLLPSGTLAYSKTSNSHRYTLFSPPCRTVLSYRSSSGAAGVTKYPNAFFPGFIMTTQFSPGLSYCYIYMLDSNLTSVCDLAQDTPLYKMPFPNIHADNRICWGHNFDGGVDESININSKNAGLLLDIFKNSTFNFDLFSTEFDKVQTALNVRTIEEYFTYLTKIDSWPSELMTNIGRLGEVI